MFRLISYVLLLNIFFSCSHYKTSDSLDQQNNKELLISSSNR